MRILPQLRLINIFWAVAWLCLFFAAWPIEPQRETLIELVIFGVQWLAIPIAIGALFGHQLRGLIAGVAIYGRTPDYFPGGRQPRKMSSRWLSRWSNDLSLNSFSTETATFRSAIALASKSTCAS